MSTLAYSSHVEQCGKDNEPAPTRKKTQRTTTITGSNPPLRKIRNLILFNSTPLWFLIYTYLKDWIVLDKTKTYTNLSSISVVLDPILTMMKILYIYIGKLYVLYTHTTLR